MSGIIMSTNVGKGSTFQDMAIAFLNSISLSRSGLCDLLRLSITEQPVQTPREFIDRLDQVRQQLTGFKLSWYNGFAADSLEGDEPSISWHCQSPHPALAERNGHVGTVITLHKKHDAWEIQVTGRNEKTIKPRIEAAESGKAETVPARILATLNGCQ